MRGVTSPEAVPDNNRDSDSVSVSEYEAEESESLSENDPEETHQDWYPGMTGEDYFAFCKPLEVIGTAFYDYHEAPWGYLRFLEDERKNLEDAQILPSLDHYPEFNMYAYFNDDDSLYKLEVRWRRKTQPENPDLSLYAGYQSREDESQPERTYTYAYDANHRPQVPHKTITHRDGILIEAEIEGPGDYTLTWNDAHGWFSVIGTRSDIDDIAILLDWLWEHPIELYTFTPDMGYALNMVALEDWADREDFLVHVPDLSALGYQIDQYPSMIEFKDDRFKSAECHYAAPGNKYLFWTICTDPKDYPYGEYLGTLEELNEEDILSRFSQDWSFCFRWDSFVIGLGVNQGVTAEDIWQVISYILLHT